MPLSIATLNVNGLRNNQKRDATFNWLLSKKYDIICLQETHCAQSDIIDWSNKWKEMGGGDSSWDCGSTDSRGVAILLNKSCREDITFVQCHLGGRVIKCVIKTENAFYHITNVYAHNNSIDKKNFFTSLSNQRDNNIFDDSVEHYYIHLGDFNCAMEKRIDRSPSHQNDDLGVIELKQLLLRFDLEDTWRKQNPTSRKFTFQRNNTKSRIDYIFSSKSLSSKIFDSRINNFPFSDHNVVSIKIKLDDIQRGPGIWVMNLNTIKSDLFKNTFQTWWESWKNENVKYSDLREWWDITKTKIKKITIETSKILNKSRNKNDIKNLEKQLEDLKSKHHNNSDSAKITDIENIIKNHYINQAEAAKIRSRAKWAEEGEKSTRYFFELEKKTGTK